MNWISNVVRPKIRSIPAPRGAGQSVDQVSGDRPAGVLQGRRGQPVRHSRLELSHAHEAPRRGSRRCSTTRPGSTSPCPRYRSIRCDSATSAAMSIDWKDARSKTGLNDAVKLGFGRLDGLAAVIGVQDFDFYGRLARHGGGRGCDQGPRHRGGEGLSIRAVRGVGRRAHAGGHPGADAIARAPPSRCSACARRAGPTSSC